MENNDQTIKNSIYFLYQKKKKLLLPQTNVIIGTKSVPWDDKVKYLGVMLDKKLLFNEHIKYIVHKFNTTIKILYSLINRKSELNIHNKRFIRGLQV